MKNFPPALAGFPASLANDGRAKNPDSDWATDISKDKDPWRQVEFEKPTNIARVQIIGYFGDRRSYGFTVECSHSGWRGWHFGRIGRISWNQRWFEFYRFPNDAFPM